MGLQWRKSRHSLRLPDACPAQGKRRRLRRRRHGMAEEHYDIAIVGGGPVGMTLALALTRSMDGLRIAMLDRRDFVVPQDHRAFAISAGVKRIFETLGVWRAVADKAEPILSMRITDSGTGDIARPLFLSF